MFGNNKKDLTTSVDDTLLRHIILIDDDESYVVVDQESNLLRVAGASAEDGLHRCKIIPRGEAVSMDGIPKWFTIDF